MLYCDHTKRFFAALKTKNDEGNWDPTCPCCNMFSSNHHFWEDHYRNKKSFTEDDVDQMVQYICEPYGNHITEVLEAGNLLKNYLSGSPPAKTRRDSETEAMEYYSQEFQRGRK